MDLIPWAVRAKLTGIPTDAKAMDEGIQNRTRLRKHLRRRLKPQCESVDSIQPAFFSANAIHYCSTFNSVLLKKAFFSGRADEEGNKIILPLTPRGAD
jgi:hypothetical protein